MAEQFTKFITNAQTKMGNYRRLSLLRFRQLCLACVGLHLVVRKLSSRRQNCSAGTDYEKSPFLDIDKCLSQNAQRHVFTFRPSRKLNPTPTPDSPLCAHPHLLPEYMRVNRPIALK